MPSIFYYIQHVFIDASIHYNLITMSIICLQYIIFSCIAVVVNIMMSSIFNVKFWIVGAVAYTAFTGFIKKVCYVLLS